MSVILMTTLLYKALILQGEIWCWSLFGLKGLTLGGMKFAQLKKHDNLVNFGSLMFLYGFIKTNELSINL